MSLETSQVCIFNGICDHVILFYYQENYGYVTLLILEVHLLNHHKDIEV